MEVSPVVSEDTSRSLKLYNFISPRKKLPLQMPCEHQNKLLANSVLLHSQTSPTASCNAHPSSGSLASASIWTLESEWSPDVGKIGENESETLVESCEDLDHWCHSSKKIRNFGAIDDCHQMLVSSSLQYQQLEAGCQKSPQKGLQGFSWGFRFSTVSCLCGNQSRSLLLCFVFVKGFFSSVSCFFSPFTSTQYSTGRPVSLASPHSITVRE